MQQRSKLLKIGNFSAFTHDAIDRLGPIAANVFSVQLLLSSQILHIIQGSMLDKGNDTQ